MKNERNALRRIVLPVCLLAIQAANSQVSLDASFGNAGIAAMTGAFEAERIQLLSNGNLICYGYTTNPGPPVYLSMVQASFMSNGAPDAAFGQGGLITFPASTKLEYRDMDFSGGKAVTAGLMGNSGAQQPVIVRLKSNGGFDTSLGGTGILYTSSVPQHTSHVFNSVLIQPDQKIVAAGTGYTSGGTEMIIRRFLPDGSPDNTFGAGGIAVFPAFHNLTDITLNGSGRIIGITTDGNVISVLRLNPNGSADTTFGAQGVTSFSLWSPPNPPMPSGGVGARKVLIQGDNHALILSNDPSGSSYFTRLSVFGEPAIGFGSNGTVQMPNIYLFDFLLQPNGKILAGATTTMTPGVLGCALFRLLPNGIPDASFGNNGVLQQAAPNNADFGFKALALQPDQKILAAGGVYLSNSYSIAVMRFANNDLLGVQQFNAEDGLSLCPNPLTGLSVLNTGGIDSGTLTLSDMQGRVIMKNEFSGASSTIERGNLSPGIYLLTVEGIGMAGHLKVLVE